jgi:hypothetical protein
MAPGPAFRIIARRSSTTASRRLYRYKSAVDEGGVEALLEKYRRRANVKNLPVSGLLQRIGHNRFLRALI